MAYMPDIRCAAMNSVEGNDSLDRDVFQFHGILVKHCGEYGFVKIGGHYYCRHHADVIRNYQKGLSSKESSPAFNVDVVLPDGTVIPGRHLMVASGGRPTADRCVKHGSFIGGSVRRTSGGNTYTSND